jgi:Dolichyl-phosphate-mannose-protein mannosyltransferase
MDENSQMGVPPETSGRRLSWVVTWLLAPVGLSLLVLFLTRLFRLSSSETFDEFTYLRLGVRIFRYRDFECLSSPMVPPLPILLETWLPALRARSLPESDGWESAVPDLIRQARLLTSILVGVPLVGVVYAWLARRRGWLVGVLGGGLVALSPSVLAASSIATTDACFVLFALLALAALHRYQVQPSRWSFVLLGSSMGLALASKQSAVILFAVALVEILIKLPARKPGWTQVDFCFWALFRSGTWLAGLVALAFLVDWGLYGFKLGPRFGDGGAHVTIPIIVPMVANLFPDGEAIMEFARRLRPPLALDTFVGQMNHASQGHAAFLMGQYSSQGWWYFFPVALGLKSTPAELLMMGLVIFFAFRPGSWRDPARRLWLCAAGVMLGAGICSSLNIGHRYMLLIYPLIVLIVVDWLGEKAARWPARVIASGVLLLTWQAISLAGIAPHYLAYFNSLCGGPSQGYRYLVDSSLDWGQDLPSLRRALEARGYHKVALCYFGTARPSAYGLRSVDWMGVGGDDPSACDWLAISATSLQGVYGASDALKRFADLPSTPVGYSIFLYDLNDQRVRPVWDAIRSRFRPPPEAVPREPE